MSYPVSNARFWRFAPLSAVALYFLCACMLGFQGPGMYYDEAIFLNGAVHVLSSAQEPSFAHDPWSWCTIFGRRWPIMVLPYVGAVRNYLALIPFAIFGPTYYSARIPTALVGAFGIWTLSILMRDQIGAKSAALVSLALSIHPAYVALTIFDLGVAEWIVPFAVLSITLARFLRAPTTGRAFWLGVAMGFGVWTRANIAWLLGSAILAGAVVLGKKMLVPVRQVAALIAGGIIGGAPLLWYEIRSRGATFEFLRSMAESTPLSRLAGHRLDLLSQIFLMGRGQRAIWNAPPMPLWQPIIVSTIVAAALYVCLRSPGLSKPRQTVFGRVAAFTFLFLLACMFLSRLNVTDHHLIALVPIAAIPVVIGAQEICRRWRSARYAIGALAVLYVILALQWNLVAARQIRATGGVGLWSNAIDTLTVYLERNCQDRKVKVLDWGLSNNIFVLSNSRISPVELFWGATAERSGLGKVWKDEISPGDVYVLHSPALVQFPDAADGFRRALAVSPLPLRRTAFRQKTGAPYAEVVEILVSPQ
jgi:hypothetical protein